MSAWSVGDILKTSNGYWRTCALHTGVRLDVFTLLGENLHHAEDIAKKAGADLRGMEYLLNALVGMGLLVKQDGCYSNTKQSLRFLCSESKESLNQIILHHNNILHSWAHLDRAVRTGQPVSAREGNADQERENFLMGMFNLAKLSAPIIAEGISLGSSAKLLDLGGGPGTYAIYFCLENKGLEATIFDRPTSEPFAKKVVEQFNLSERIDFIGGDFNSDPLPEKKFDVAWLSHILHSNGPEACQQLIHKVADSLLPGGRILIHDFFLTDEKDGPEFPALFALNMLTATSDGRSYSTREVQEMLTAAGFESIELIDFQSPNNSSIISAKL